jgi:hypothetical protein
MVCRSRPGARGICTMKLGWAHVTALDVVVFAPAGLLGIATIGILIGSLLGWAPLWPTEDFNMAELAGMKNMAGVLAAQRSGADINAKYRVRAGIITQGAVEATPLDAAIFSRENWFVQFMLDNGARITDANRTTLACLARELGAKDVERLVCPEKAADCSNVPLTVLH